MVKVAKSGKKLEKWRKVVEIGEKGGGGRKKQRKVAKSGEKWQKVAQSS